MEDLYKYVYSEVGEGMSVFMRSGRCLDPISVFYVRQGGLDPRTVLQQHNCISTYFYDIYLICERSKYYLVFIEEEKIQLYHTVSVFLLISV